ncbi:IS66 family transposase [Microbulbifer epialgicus]|uniref:Transposase n=1 Tax=Microbulbifer epialgicus TaxID=393907 RepID=A0ABV4P5X7_9GAMM
MWLPFNTKVWFYRLPIDFRKQKAMNYCLKYWNGLCAFLNDGRLEVDKNLTEQEIKPFVMARKNFLFASSVIALKHYACTPV